ncbi:MAG: hypothetical protein D6788_06735 [Planctomycetota bacterium]|nr:MAG: hypothetical protein D6788_06735 [Planctomycetota bacterium]
MRRLFAGLVEQTFCTEVGLCDPALTSYLSDLLVDFTHVDRLSAIRRFSGQKLEHLAALLIALSDELPEDETERDRTLYRNIGDFALFWTGVYPEHLRREQGSRDVLHDYVDQGKRSYAIVSELVGENERPPGRLFRQLSEEFEYCAYGLGLVRREWEHTRPPHGAGPDLVY